MLLYRITRSVYAEDLSGTGARLYGGRWNSVGKGMLYLASSRALAVLEVLVHLTPMLIPEDFEIVTLEVPEDLQELDVKLLPEGWQQFPQPDILRNFGDRFITENKHLMLKVPSAIVSQEFNFLVNPLNALIKNVKIKNRQPFTFDQRLL